MLLLGLQGCSAPKPPYFRIQVSPSEWTALAFGLLGQNRGNRNPRMLVRAGRAVCRAPVYKVSVVQETKEEACEKLKRKEH